MSMCAGPALVAAADASPAFAFAAAGTLCGVAAAVPVPSDSMPAAAVAAARAIRTLSVTIRRPSAAPIPARSKPSGVA